MTQSNQPEKTLITPASGQSAGLSFKVCGMQNPGNIRQVAELEPDYMGLIFYKKSLRYFDEELPQIPAEIKLTGVFVNSSIEEIIEKVNAYKLNAVQLHGSESADFCKGLRASLQKLGNTPEIIKVFQVGPTFNFKSIKPFEGIVDYFLFDTKGENPGGNGTQFDWDILKSYPSNTPFFLSGGIGPDNWKEVRNLKSHFYKMGKPHLLYAVDVNSKFELKPGMKKLKELKEFKSNINS